ncbi:hypothetical protein [Roseibium aggregatum]|uniref:Uncharacterized protein n=1 Tax=Roseibium aggregatum TaxID=187304 RepID=A0A939EEJ8_9HYPH|nr:hypothetical protein [Roseibium aggregatum]MBN9670703.1 hypothetical protein [Roseibium aggregatum]
MTAVEGVTTAGQTSSSKAGQTDPGFRPDALKNAGKAENRSFSFADFIDVINPLQHIPGVAEIYRSITNDQISDEARKTGNVIYGFALGGPVGVGAMMAYNAVGDRWSAGADQQAPAGVASAEQTPVPSGPTEGAGMDSEVGTETGSAPVPDPKPAEISGEVPGKKPAERADRAEVMGETVAAAKAPTGVPLNLAELISGSRQTKDATQKTAISAKAPTSTEASSVSYLEGAAEKQRVEPYLPDQDDLGHLATHQANRLPLDVLKALQERHAQRTASERT